ncbi:hypothetical protein BC628DRAFT_817636 [Trametes gibbosa]|nr:hypothetical protein BC628DRAFT_817636 [Trametes gibbosa]
MESEEDDRSSESWSSPQVLTLDDLQRRTSMLWDFDEFELTPLEYLTDMGESEVAESASDDEISCHSQGHRRHASCPVATIPDAEAPAEAPRDMRRRSLYELARAELAPPFLLHMCHTQADDPAAPPTGWDRQARPGGREHGVHSAP